MKLKRLIFKLLAILLLASINACGAKEARKIGVSGVPYNYSDQTVLAVRVNGQSVSLVMKAVKPGGVSGGGVICCIDLPDGATDAQVEVDLGDSKYVTQAKIERWWPDLASYAVIHVLPGRTVVIEVRSVDTWPRKDLLEQQLRLNGIKRAVTFNGPMNIGPMERTDGVK
jgi:acylphosphatase